MAQEGASRANKGPGADSLPMSVWGGREDVTLGLELGLRVSCPSATSAHSSSSLAILHLFTQRPFSLEACRSLHRWGSVWRACVTRRPGSARNFLDHSYIFWVPASVDGAPEGVTS